MTTHGRDKTGPVRDDEVKKEMANQLRASRQTRVEEPYELQPSGEDQPSADTSPEAQRTGGTPRGITPEGVETRSSLARSLGRAAFPADRAGIVARLRDGHADDRLIRLAETLPGDKEYDNVQSVSRDLGLGAEKPGT
ncbi:DUF2795 domain-containing protein [Streptomyces sp. ICBB 8177]|uniref:DUF2795 domain-containing protein n=1 Tax=Streptomyces sp. ICBB 8177 TaxID=563922 RepID=UPI000D682186|nr:DUF2795 domain-containing protein [Streptomyces sp. ICBB 8177]PWI42974.1 hypothetical protein CK485_12090 [Streptomyces sp. ICBB 8177]